jgi:hypothetical protein
MQKPPPKRRAEAGSGKKPSPRGRPAAERYEGTFRRDRPAREKPQRPFEPGRRERRALSHVGGAVTFQGGTADEQAAIKSALDVSADEMSVMKDVHGFHSYPARLHPLTAHRLIEGLSKPGARVFDPFCGSGTVIAEARALGRVALGSDLNPLAVELSWLKSRGPTAREVEQLLASAERIAEMAEERRVRKAEPYVRYGADDRERYPIHVLLELDSIAHGIGLLPKTEQSRILRLVVSSILTKVAYSEGDTTRQKAPRRLPSGFTIGLFMEKTRELCERFAAYRDRIGDRAPRATVATADARAVEGLETASIDLIVTSPPYPGVYDYLEHHIHRLRWLGLKPGFLQEQEIGSRRGYRHLRFDEAVELWREEMGASLREMRRLLANDGRGVVIVADSVIDRQAFRADEAFAAIAGQSGLEVKVIASQERPIFLYGAEAAFDEAPRREHLIVVRPGERPRRAKQSPEARDREEPRAPSRTLARSPDAPPKDPTRRRIVSGREPAAPKKGAPSGRASPRRTARRP